MLCSTIISSLFGILILSIFLSLRPTFASLIRALSVRFSSLPPVLPSLKACLLNTFRNFPKPLLLCSTWYLKIWDKQSFYRKMLHFIRFFASFVVNCKFNMTPHFFNKVRLIWLMEKRNKQSTLAHKMKTPNMRQFHAFSVSEYGVSRQIFVWNRFLMHPLP